MHDTAIQYPIPGEIWRHHKGGRYQVEMLTNLHSDDPAKFPVTVVYTRIKDGKTWSRPADAFMEKFTKETP
jgi:hypothetical protein